MIEYLKNHDVKLLSICVIEYLGYVALKKDVIRVIYPGGKSNLYTSCDKDGYMIYNHERSAYRGEFIWEYMYGGSISEVYSAFRDKELYFLMIILMLN